MAKPFKGVVNVDVTDSTLDWVALEEQIVMAFARD